MLNLEDWLDMHESPKEIGGIVCYVRSHDVAGLVDQLRREKAHPVSVQDVEEFIRDNEFFTAVANPEDKDGTYSVSVYDIRAWMEGHVRVPVNELEDVLWLAEKRAVKQTQKQGGHSSSAAKPCSPRARSSTMNNELIERIDSLFSAYTEGGKISSSMSVMQIMMDCKAALSEPVSVLQDVEEFIAEHGIKDEVWYGDVLSEHTYIDATDLRKFFSRSPSGCADLQCLLDARAFIVGEPVGAGRLTNVVSERDIRAWMAGHARVPVDLLDDIWACAHSEYSLEDLKSKIQMLTASKEINNE